MGVFEFIYEFSLIAFAFGVLTVLIVMMLRVRYDLFYFWLFHTIIQGRVD